MMLEIGCMPARSTALKRWRGSSDAASMFVSPTFSVSLAGLDDPRERPTPRIGTARPRFPSFVPTAPPPPPASGAREEEPPSDPPAPPQPD